MNKLDSVEYPESILKSVKRIGTSSLALGIFTLVVNSLALIFYSRPPSDVLVQMLLFYGAISVVFIILGTKIKKESLISFEKVPKLLNILIIYTFVVIVFLFMASIVPGVFAIILLIDIFKIKKDIKKNLNE